MKRPRRADAPMPARSNVGTPSVASGVDAARFPKVGMGASAGGLAAFGTVSSGMPADTDPGMAIVLMQHLAPDHKCILTELNRFRGLTSMSDLTVIPLDNMMEGAFITRVEIPSMKKAHGALRESDARFMVQPEQAPSGIPLQEQEGQARG